MTLDVLIVGAGQIAAGYDTPDSSAILTHAHAINEHPNFRLLGFYDVDYRKAEAAAKKWNARVFSEFPQSDIVVICSPDTCHLESIRQAASMKPKLIVLEKPIATNQSNAEEILEVVKGIPTQVNFTRRFVPQFQSQAVAINDYGTFITGFGLYGKGFIHNGSHMIDLLRLLLGEISSIEFTNAIDDYTVDDTTKTAIICFNSGGEFFMRGVDSNCYTIFELDLYFEKARIRVLDSGDKIQIYYAEKTKKYEGYFNLKLRDEVHTELDNAMYYLYKNLYDFIANDVRLLSPIESAYTDVVYR